jgi:2-amino-4-hydroxy-6-hydroxymethyldihydropteridine diphosphokinase
MTTAFLGLGSNLGDRAAALDEALARLDQRGVRTVRRSSRYLTEPVGGPPQPWFLNMVIEVETSMVAEDLLSTCLAIENAMGRIRTEPWGPRTVDIDILLYDCVVHDTPGLTLPHPRLHERRFVLEPLAEIAPTVTHPRLLATARELCDRCPDASRVQRQPSESLR